MKELPQAFEMLSLDEIRGPFQSNTAQCIKDPKLFYNLDAAASDETPPP